MTPASGPIERRIPVPGAGEVSGLLIFPPEMRALVVLAHGAGAGMRHPFMDGVARRLAALRIGTLRYQFPYMEQGEQGEQGRRRIDPEPVVLGTVRAAVEAGRQAAGGLPLLAGGKSFGGRMTSRAAAGPALRAGTPPLAGVAGLVFLGFPLHPAGQPGVTRADHLAKVDHPMLFLQGTRDALADLTLLEPIVRTLGHRATLRVIEHADHSFHVLKGSGRTDQEVLDELAGAVAEWLEDRT